MAATDRIERFMAYGIGDLFDITGWPRWMRRTFVLALPISAPAYIAIFFVTIIGCVIAFIVAALIDAWR